MTVGGDKTVRPVMHSLSGGFGLLFLAVHVVSTAVRFAAQFLSLFSKLTAQVSSNGIKKKKKKVIQKNLSFLYNYNPEKQSK